MRLALLASIFAVGAAATLTGCSGSVHAPSPPSALGSADQPLASMILEQSGHYNEYTSELDQAQQVLIQRCMATHGLKYFVAPPGGLAQLSNGALEIPSYDMAVRQTDGYGLFKRALAPSSSPVGQQTGDRSTDPEDLYMQSLSPSDGNAYALVLFGPRDASGSLTVSIVGMGSITAPTKGCVAQAQKQIYGTIADAISVTVEAASLGKNLSDQVQADPEYGNAMAAWAACMQPSGFSYKSPRDAVVQLAKQFTDAGPTAALHQLEVRVATSDAECGTKVGLRDRVHLVIARLASQLPASIEGTALRDGQLQAQAVARAKSVLGQ